MRSSRHASSASASILVEAAGNSFRALRPIRPNCSKSSPDDRRSLAQWAEEAGLSERSLSRHWRELAGVSFHDWRQRAKLAAALTMLEEGYSKDEITRRLSYNGASAFIAMVRQMTGASPERLRREKLHRAS
ncbi:MAG: helix-turn-helix domain-containing protein [Paraburkholderia sp.]|uniref:helix-turn-helix domain-containing protein n=1 Tax=Paraburkholderia sp. TaxID=1926495 RepID=UPI002016D234|nr:helix-turn-helix domain-containing protein [Burkholderia sp. 4M9327F10]